MDTTSWDNLFTTTLPQSVGQGAAATSLGPGTGPSQSAASTPDQQIFRTDTTAAREWQANEPVSAAITVLVGRLAELVQTAQAATQNVIGRSQLAAPEQPQAYNGVLSDLQRAIANVQSAASSPVLNTNAATAENTPVPAQFEEPQIPATIAAFEQLLRARDAEIRTHVDSLDGLTVAPQHTAHDYTCSMCLQDYRPNDIVTRLQCGHVHHRQCWVGFCANRQQQGQEACCPLCRGAGNAIASWPYVQPGLLIQPGVVNWAVVQLDGTVQVAQVDHGISVEEQLEQMRRQRLQNTVQDADQHLLETPRSMVTQHMPESPQPQPSEASSQAAPSVADAVFISIPEPARDTEELPENVTSTIEAVLGQSPNYITLPSTYLDAKDWVTECNNWLGAPVPEANRANIATGEATASYHAETRLPDGRPCLLVDPGSIGNLGGDAWAQQCCAQAMQHQRKPTETKRARPLSVSGVGKGSQECKYDVSLPMAFRKMDDTYTAGDFTTPIAPQSMLPGLLGYTTLKGKRAILDMGSQVLYFPGPGDVDLSRAMPCGTDAFQLEEAPSGHMVLPCCEFAGYDQQSARGHLSMETSPMALHAEQSGSSSSASGPNQQ